MAAGVGQKNSVNRRKELEELNHLRVIFVEKTMGLIQVLKQKKKTVRDVTQAVYEYLVQEKLQQKIAQLEKNFRTGENWHWRKSMHRYTGSLWNYLINL